MFHIKGKLLENILLISLVCDRVIIELKCVEHFSRLHEAQLLNYLKATGVKVGLLVNSNHPKVEKSSEWFRGLKNRICVHLRVSAAKKEWLIVENK